MRTLFFYTSLLFLNCCISCNTPPTPTEATTTTEEVSPETTPTAPPSQEEPTPTAATPNCTGQLTTFLNDPDLSGTNVRKEPKGAIVYKMVRESEEDEFLIEISESQKGWFKVAAIESMEGPVELDYTSAWVHGSVLGVSTKNYGGESITFYKEANANAATVNTTTELLYNLSLVDFCGEWVRVKGEGFEGWIQQEWLCGSSLTNCS